mgnify:CR=1 FL=1
MVAFLVTFKVPKESEVALIEDYDRILHLGMTVAERYGGLEAISAEAVPFIEAQARKRLVVEFEVEHVVSWDHTKITGY